MTRKWKIIVFLCVCIIIAIIITLDNISFKTSFANLSAFPRQEIADSYDDWNVIRHPNNIISETYNNHTLFLKPAISNEECKIKDPINNDQTFLTSDIDSVSYLKNNDILNTTFWLTRPFAYPQSITANFSSLPPKDVNISQTAVGINIKNKINKSLSEIVKEEINSLIKENLTDFDLYTNGSIAIILDNKTAEKIDYTYIDNMNEPLLCKFCHVIKIFTLENGKLYTIFSKEEKRIYSNIISDERQTIIDSIKIGDAIDDINKEDTTFSLYENGTYRIKMHYPFYWNINNTDDLQGNTFDRIVRFSNPIVDEVLRLTIDNRPIHMEKYLNETIRDYKASYIGFKIYNNGTNTNFSEGRAMYNLQYKFTNNYGIDYIAIEKGILVGEDKMYFLEFVSPLNRFSNSWHADIKKIFDLFEIYDTSILTYFNPNSQIKLQYPSEWTLVENYNDSMDKHVIANVTLYSPVKGIYPLYRDYTISFDVNSIYDSPVDYAARLYWNSKYKTWNNTLEEFSINNKLRLLDNQVINNTDYIKNGESYILLPVDLSKINSPDQFQVFFSIEDDFIKDDRLCLLVDQSNQMSYPPPNYSIIFSPTSLELRPGENKFVQLTIQSNSNLYANVSLSTDTIDKDINANFTSKKLSISPFSNVTSTLQINATDNAVSKSYSLPIAINIAFPSSAEFNGYNNTIATENPINTILPKTQTFTVAVLPQLSFDESFKSFWDIFGGVVGAILSLIGAVVGSSLITHFIEKKWKKNNLN